MNSQSIVAIGDIHGCPKSLEALLEKLQEHEDRTIVFVGDYIDRGPDSKSVVDLLLDYRKGKECVFLRGNHEQMLLDAYEQGDMSLWLMNGGGVTIESYREGSERLQIPEDHLEFYRETKLYYDTPDYFFVHAGVSPGQTIEESLQNEDNYNDFLWERSHLNAPETPWEKKVVFGHTPKAEPVQRENMIGIDTGCVFSSLGFGMLTAVLLPEEEFIQQECLD